MTNVQSRENVSVGEEIGLSRMIRREFETMLFHKETYDLDYPEHKKDIVPAQLKRMARDKVVEELCIPPCTAET